MGRDKAKDDKYFNCSQQHEIDYVAGLYKEKEKVRNFLITKCKDGTIKNNTHKEVYQLIEKELGYPIPN